MRNRPDQQCWDQDLRSRSRTYQYLPPRFFFLYLTREECSPARKSMVRRQNIAAPPRSYSEFTLLLHLRVPPGSSTSSRDRAALCVTRGREQVRRALRRCADLSAGPLAIGPFRRKRRHRNDDQRDQRSGLLLVGVDAQDSEHHEAGE